MSTAGLRDYYETLGVARTASPEEIKQAYRRLARQHHPDMNPGDPNAEARFKEVSQAYHVLGDADRRAHFDRYGRVAGAGPGIDFVDMTEMFENLVGDFLQGFPGFGKRRAAGRDIKLDVHVTLNEAAKGVEKTVEFFRMTGCDACAGRGADVGTSVDPCPACAGRGEVRFQQGFVRMVRQCGRCDGRGTLPRVPCAKCGGKGLARKQERLAVTLPPGVEDGATRTVRGFGDASTGTGVSGDLELNIRILEHPLFTRQGSDLQCKVPVSFPQAALGAMIDVPTLEGKVRMRVPPGTQPGFQLRLRGKGMPKFGGYGAGDQIVTIQVEIPESLSDEQRALVEKLAESMNEEVHSQRRTFVEKLRSLFEG